MTRRIGAALAVLLGLFALGALSQLSPIFPASGQTIPATWTPANAASATAAAANTRTPTTTPFAVCIAGTPFIAGATPPALATGVACVTPTSTQTETPTPTHTATTTNTATASPVAIYLNVVYNYYGGKEITVFYQPNGCITASDYRFDVDYGDGRPHVIVAPPNGGCPTGSPFTYTPPAPNYPTGAFTITVTLSQVNPPAQARLIATASTVADTRPTATPTMTGTPTNTATATRTNTPFIVTNRQYQPFIRR